MKPSRIHPALLGLFAVFVTISTPARAADAFWKSRDAFLGQHRPANTPEIFAPGRLADAGMVVMGRVAWSKDGKEFYYTQDDSWDSLEHARIMVVRYQDGHWMPPTVVSEQFISPTLSLDGKTLYMRHGNMHNVWQARRTANGWSEPVQLLDKPFGLYDFMPTRSGTFYIGSTPDADDVRNGSTLVFSTLTLSGDDVVVHSLGQPLNRPGFNGDLYVAPDESYMIISTNETPTFESELYISFRKADRTWSTPISLGARINNGLAHRWGQYVTPDGKYLFYSYGTSVKDCAVYWVRFDTLLKALRAQAAVAH